MERAEQTRLRRMEKIICHCGIFWKFDSRLGGKEGKYFEEKERGG